MLEDLVMVLLSFGNCMGNFKILTSEEISELLAELPDWQVVDSNLLATFVFPDFRSAIAFINLVAIESEVQNHHPGWANTYKKVEFKFCTHDAGNKITNLDIKLAKYISKAALQLM